MNCRFEGLGHGIGVVCAPIAWWDKTGGCRDPTSFPGPYEDRQESTMVRFWLNWFGSFQTLTEPVPMGQTSRLSVNWFGPNLFVLA